MTGLQMKKILVCRKELNDSLKISIQNDDFKNIYKINDIILIAL